MMAWTSPAFTVQVDPLEDLLVFGLDLQILDIKHVCDVIASLPTDPSSLTLSSFCASTANSIGSSRKTSLQKPLTIMLTASSVGEAALAAVEDLVLADLRGRRLVLDLRRRVLDLEVRERVRAALVADEQRVALRVVARVLRVLADPHQAAVGVLAVAGGDALRDDRAAGVLPDVDHLRAGVGLLPVVGRRHRVELADRVVALQDAAGILPGDRRAGLDLRPGDLRAAARRTGRAWSRSCRCRPCRPCRRDTSSGSSST